MDSIRVKSNYTMAKITQANVPDKSGHIVRLNVFNHNAAASKLTHLYKQKNDLLRKPNPSFIDAIAFRLKSSALNKAIDNALPNLAENLGVPHEGRTRESIGADIVRRLAIRKSPMAQELHEQVNWHNNFWTKTHHLHLHEAGHIKQLMACARGFETNEERARSQLEEGLTYG